VNDVLRAPRGAGVRTSSSFPIGFVCDHVEVLYDLDVEARRRRRRSGSASRARRR
jgi:ferrochelatase